MTDKPILTVHPQSDRPVVLTRAQVDEWVERVLRAGPPVGQFELVMRKREFWAEADRKNYSFLFLLSQAWLVTALLLAGSLVVVIASLPQTTFSKIGFVFGILLLGTLLYCFRERQPGFYGALEIGVGVGSTAYVVVKYADGNGDNDSLAFLVSVAAALYIIVRGYDNLFKAIDKSKHRGLARFWRRIFQGKDDSAAGYIALCDTRVNLESKAAAEIIVDCCRFMEGLVSDDDVKGKWKFSDEDWTRVGHNRPLQDAIRAERERRIFNGDAARESNKSTAGP